MSDEEAAIKRALEHLAVIDARQRPPGLLGSDAALAELDVLLRERDEAGVLLAALTLYAPHSSSTVRLFAVAHERACAWLAEHSTLTPNEIRAVLGSLTEGEQ